MKLTLKANSKINLLLDITGIKKNGYHKLFTIMQSISLGDIITVEKTVGEEIQFPAIPRVCLPIKGILCINVQKSFLNMQK